MADIKQIKLPNGTVYDISGKYNRPYYGNGTTEIAMRSLAAFARANRLAFLPADQIIIEKTTDGGTTWTDAGYNDVQKQELFATRGATIQIPLLNGAKSTQCGIRITITAMKYNVPSGTSETDKYAYWNSSYVKSAERYTNLKEMWFWVSTNNDRMRVQVYYATGAAPNNWTTVFNTDFGLSGWSGSDWIRWDASPTFGGATSQTGNQWNWRIIFWSRMVDGASAFASNTAQVISGISGYGDSVWAAPNGLMKEDHLYTWDRNMNATFPAQITATQFNGTATRATADASGNTISTTYEKVGNRTTTLSSSSTDTQYPSAKAVYDELQSIPTNHLVPIQSKTFTGVIGTENTWANGTFFFGKIVPTSFYANWGVRMRVYAECDGSDIAKATADLTLRGSQSALNSYASFNLIQNTSYRPVYNHELYRATSAGVTGGYGHLFGERLQSSWKPTTAANSRTITIDILECINCTFTFFDSPLKYANVPGTGSTNYSAYSEMDFANNGLQETGDSNDPNYYNREYYPSRKTYTALYRYQFVLTRKDRTVLPVNTVSNSTATTKTLTTEAFDPFGEIFYYNTTTSVSAGENLPNGYLYRQVMADLRYSFNCGQGNLTAREPLYLVVTPQSDGTAKLYSSPLSQTLPTTDDGLLYIYLGMVYEDTSPYRVNLSINHPVYMYVSGAAREVSGQPVSYKFADANKNGNVVITEQVIGGLDGNSY